MERVKIILPNSFSFACTIQVRISDINYGGHVGNDSFLSLIHEARMQYLKSFGYSEMNVGGVGLIMADIGLEFKKELHYNDLVNIQVQSGGFNRIGFDIYYLLTVEQNGVVSIAGKAKTGMLCFDYENKKRVSLPEDALLKLSS